MKRYRLSLTALTVTAAMAIAAVPAAAQTAYTVHGGEVYYQNEAGQWTDTADRAAPGAELNDLELERSAKIADIIEKDKQFRADMGKDELVGVKVDADGNPIEPTPEAEAFAGETYTTQDGQTFYRHADGIHWVSTPDRAGEDAILNDLELENSAKYQEIINKDYAEVAANTKTESYTTLDGQTFYRTTDGQHWVDTQDRAPGILNDLELERSEEIAGIIAADKEARAKQDIAKIAGIALPAALIIGGIMWYLNKDGKTYVQNQSRVDAAPTADEKAASEKMLNENVEEVVKQAEAAQAGDPAATGGQAAAGDRGMAAETGNNTVPRALAGIALMSILGAVAFAARRRLFA